MSSDDQHLSRERGAVVGYLVSLSDDEWRSVEKEVGKIRLSGKVEQDRVARREEYALLETRLEKAGIRVVGLQRGCDYSKGIAYLGAVWPKGRTPHLLRLYDTNLYSICSGRPHLAELSRVNAIRGHQACSKCLHGRQRHGFWKGYLLRHDALGVKLLERIA